MAAPGVQEIVGMSSQQEQFAPQDGKPEAAPQEPQAQPNAIEGHGGQGSDSARQQLEAWEQRRIANSGGKRRHGAG